MHSILFTLILFALTSVCPIRLFGQKKNVVTPFPTYQQIKQATDEIIDYVPKKGDSVVTGRQQTINLFDYPTYSVTYILNGESTTDRKYAQKLIDPKGTQIDRIKIGQPTADGKLRIEIDYSNC